MTNPQFTPGSLVSARGREWVVLPNPDAESQPNVLFVRPIDGVDDETTLILTDLEDATPAQFDLPTSDDLGSDRSCRYLRDALRLSVRNSAGPFRSFGHIAVEPRPYQFVPLILALKQDPTRLLIADDVGIGKTVEAALIVRELLDRGDAKRFCVLCPPHLAEQWQRELYEKFRLDAKLVLSSTVKALERECAQGESLFDVHPYTVVSIDFIKTDMRQKEFLRTAPEIVVFDEAHSIAFDPLTSARHQRYKLASQLCKDKNRHVILVTATPHSGKENAFRSLLGLLNDDFLDESKYPADLSGKENERRREEMARYFVQRRRGDIKDFLGEKTAFPECKEEETGWLLSSAYRAFFDDVLAFVKGLVDDPSGASRAKRIRWWSALSLLRSAASSPEAAKSTLARRSELAPDDVYDETTDDLEKIDAIGEKYALDADAPDPDSPDDMPLGADVDPERGQNKTRREKMNALAQRCDALRGPDVDFKLAALIKEIKALKKANYNPIVFCRFIPTVDYLYDELRKVFPPESIDGVTGRLIPEDREARVAKLAEQPWRVLVCTDCLSEGINLQESFDATIHYDLSWNPTRHEQREGRVNRFGQTRSPVLSRTFYGKDVGIDGIVLDVLLRKHQKIKKSLGVSVPTPTNTKDVLESIVSGYVMRGTTSANVRGRKSDAPLLPGVSDYLDDLYDEKMLEEAKKYHKDWDDVANREEKRSQTFFAHRATSANIGEIKRELDETRRSIGSSAVAKEFVLNALTDSGAVVKKLDDSGVYELDLSSVGRELRDYFPDYQSYRAKFDMPVTADVEYVNRTHPIVENLADYVVNAALDSTTENSLAKRCGVVRTSDVSVMTTLLLLRCRFHLLRKEGEVETQTLAEDVQVVGFSGLPSNPTWLTDEEIERILKARPSGNVPSQQARTFIDRVLGGYADLKPRLDQYAVERAAALKDAHERVKIATKTKVKTDVVPELPPDVVGVYVYLP